MHVRFHCSHVLVALMFMQHVTFRWIYISNIFNGLSPDCMDVHIRMFIYCVPILRYGVYRHTPVF